MSENLQEPTDDLGMLHVLAHNAHAVLAEYEVCKKCCKDYDARIFSLQAALPPKPVSEDSISQSLPEFLTK